MWSEQDERDLQRLQNKKEQYIAYIRPKIKAIEALLEVAKRSPELVHFGVSTAGSSYLNIPITLYNNAIKLYNDIRRDNE